MQLNIIEQEILSTVQSLPMEKQQEILNFSLFLKDSMQKNQVDKQNPTAFASALIEFLKEVESEPLDIDISAFDRNRPRESGREIDL
ncbi:MAG: hypothetical protein BWK80_13230 [Desulfobacteraceae bacterium IS3]|nr:MAG: hypothetical protein BWK80_13230 [Desulfobacteraceae bacterium IS3]